jgi:outer membrane protein OmpA-like peptidoglycan-associated protein
LLTWLTVTALASPTGPVGSVHVEGAVETSLGAGLGGTLGWQSERSSIAVGLDGLWLDGAPLGVARPQLRLFPGREGVTRGHLLLGAGVDLGSAGVRPLAEAGVGLDIGDGPAPLRVTAAYQAPIGGTGRALLQLGLLFGKRAAPEPVPVVEAPSFSAAMVWVPGPVCAWLPPDEASEAWTRADGDPTRASLVPEPSRAPAGSAEGASEPTGDLVVAAHPGDRVWIDGAPAEVAADGIAWAARPEGRVDVRIVGGGRVLDEVVAVAADGTLWFAAPAPDDRVRVTFPAGSAQLSPDGAAEVAAYGEHLGDWSVQVWGSASPEGTVQDNIALAKARANAVAEALEASGVDPARITVLPPRKAPEGLDPAQQRAAVVAAVAVESP